MDVQQGAGGAEFDSELALGNAAFQQQMGDDAIRRDLAPLEVVGEVAAPMVERTMWALQLSLPDGDLLERQLAILQRSSLPQAQTAQLMDNLRSDHLLAQSVKDAVEQCVGSDSGDTRGALWDALERVHGGLQHGGPTSDELGWNLNDGSKVDVTADGQSTQGRAGQLVAQLAEASAGDRLREMTEEKGGAGAAIRNLCTALHLAIWFDEEEEEEEVGWVETVVQD